MFLSCLYFNKELVNYKSRIVPLMSYEQTGSDIAEAGLVLGFAVRTGNAFVVRGELWERGCARIPSATFLNLFGISGFNF